MEYSAELMSRMSTSAGSNKVRSGSHSEAEGRAADHIRGNVLLEEENADQSSEGGRRTRR